MLFKEGASTVQDAFPDCCEIIRQAHIARVVPEEAIEVTLSSITECTLRQYSKGLKRSWEFCKRNKVSAFSGSTSEALKFFSELMPEIGSYSTLNVYRSAISLLTENELRKDARISRFFKGVAKVKLQKPKYTMTWDPAPVLNYLKTLHPNKDIALERLTKKLATLLALITGQRVQTLSKIDLQNIVITEERVQIFISERIKTSGLNRNQPMLNIPFFRNKKKLCSISSIDILQKNVSDKRR